MGLGGTSWQSVVRPGAVVSLAGKGLPRREGGGGEGVERKWALSRFLLLGQSEVQHDGAGTQAGILYKQQVANTSPARG